MSRPPPPPAPTHLLRSHSAPISAVYITDDNETIYSGDAEGTVCITSTRTLRALALWKAHTDGILGLEEFGSNFITHGRDNKLHVFKRIVEAPSSRRLGGSAALPDLPTPTLLYTMDVNALNYCRFSLLLSRGAGISSDADSALIALPNLVDSSTADIWSIPSRDRLHAAIGQETNQPIFATKPDTGRGSNGIIMSLHLFTSTSLHNSASSSASASTSSIYPETSLRLLTAYESGTVVLRAYTREGRPTSIEGQGWETIWSHKGHAETVMAMAVSKDNTFALTVSADHLIVKYELSNNSDPKAITHRTKHPGNASVAIRDDGKVCAVGGWDGCIRLYSTKSFKPLGTLRYHKPSIQSLTFAHDIALTSASAQPSHPTQAREDGNESDDEDMDNEEKNARSRWLISGSKDHRVSIWGLMAF